MCVCSLCIPEPPEGSVPNPVWGPQKWCNSNDAIKIMDCSRILCRVGGGGEGETVKNPFPNLKCTFKEKGLEGVPSIALSLPPQPFHHPLPWSTFHHPSPSPPPHLQNFLSESAPEPSAERCYLWGPKLSKQIFRGATSEDQSYPFRFFRGATSEDQSCPSRFFRGATSEDPSCPCRFLEALPPRTKVVQGNFSEGLPPRTEVVYTTLPESTFHPPSPSPPPYPT